jgi:hypothetical protein
MLRFHDAEDIMRERVGQGGLRDLIGLRFLIHEVKWAPVLHDKKAQVAILTVELEHVQGEQVKYATSEARVLRQLRHMTPEDQQLIYTVREVTGRRPSNGRYPLVLDYPFDTGSQVAGGYSGYAQA